MSSIRLPAMTGALAFLMLSTTSVLACSCKEGTDQERFDRAELVIRGRVKEVTYGDMAPGSGLPEEMRRAARGEIEIQKVLKGALKQRSVPVYTGTGMGDCGLLGLFLNSAVYYEHEKFGVFELALTKSDLAGRPIYVASMCGYLKVPRDEEQQAQ